MLRVFVLGRRPPRLLVQLKLGVWRMSDPISKFELCRHEIDRVFGPGYAAAHPDVVTRGANRPPATGRSCCSAASMPDASSCSVPSACRLFTTSRPYQVSRRRIMCSLPAYRAVAQRCRAHGPPPQLGMRGPPAGGQRGLAPLLHTDTDSFPRRKFYIRRVVIAFRRADPISIASRQSRRNIKVPIIR